MMSDLYEDIDDVVEQAEAEFDQFLTRQTEYSNYVAEKFNTVYSFKEWHQQTYGESLPQEAIDSSIEGVRDDVLELIEEHLMELNGQ